MRLSLTLTPSVQTAPSFPELLERLWREQHTGPVIVHFAGGKPHQVEILAPSERIALAKLSRSA